MNVQSILTSKGGAVYQINPETTLEEAAKLLGQYRVGTLLVMEGDDDLVGILSERDIVRAVGRGGSTILGKPTRDIMTRQVMTCTPADTIENLMEQMTSGRFRHMPVVDSGKVIGVVSIGDVVKQRIAEADMEAASMRAYIATG